MAIKPQEASAYLQSLGVDPEVADWHASQMYPQPQEAAPSDWRDVPEMTGGGGAGNAHTAPSPPPSSSSSKPIDLTTMFPAPPTPAPTPGKPAPAAAKTAPVPWNLRPKDAPAPAAPLPMKEAAAQFAKQDLQKNLDGATFAKPDETTKPGALGPMISKGGRTPHSWQVQEGLDLPETVEAYGRASREQKDAAGAARDAGELDALRQMSYLDRFEQAQNERAVRMKAQAEDRARRMDAELDKYSQMTDAVRGDQIDNSAFFTKNGTGGAFAASIAYMLGAVGGALTHTENPVIGIIRDEIDTQKKNAALRGQKLEDQRGLLGQLTRTFGDENIAEQAAWGAYLEKAKTEMAKIAANSQYDSVRAKYKQRIADIDLHYLAPTVGKLEELMQDRLVRQDVNAPAMYAGAGAGKLDKLTREEVSKIAEERQKAGLPAALSELADIDRTIDTFGSGDIPGVGAVVGHVPSWMPGMPDEAVANRQAVAAVKNKVRKSIAGASLTDGEKVELNKQLEGAYDAPSLRRVVQSFRQSLVYQDANIRSIGDDNARAEFSRREKAARNETIPLNKPSTPHVRREQ